MKIAVSMLEGSELSAWVVKATGHEVYGKAYCYYDPETGHPCITHDQKSSQYHHLRYVYLDNCCCDIHLEIQEEEKLGGASWNYEKILGGHEAFCFSPVLDYHNDFQCAMYHVREKRISLIALENTNEWRAYKGKISFIAESEIVAAMRVVVALAFGEYVDSDELVTIPTFEQHSQS